MANSVDSFDSVGSPQSEQGATSLTESLTDEDLVGRVETWFLAFCATEAKLGLVLALVMICFGFPLMAIAQIALSWYASTWVRR